MDNLKGKFLVSAKHLLDPNFFKTVVLLIEYGDQGAMGLIVNRPSAVAISHALSKHLELPDINDPVFLGGPVEPGALIVLHDREDLAENDPVIPGLYVPGSAEMFERVVRAATESPADTQFRIYSGCAGWAPEQLEGEISRGDWYLLPGSVDLVFSDDPYTVWEEAMNRVAQAMPLIDQTVERPELN